VFEAQGVKVVNPSWVAQRCGDKYVTSQLLVKSGLPTPRVLMAFSEEAALKAPMRWVIRLC
jgi:[lysine-biosynthesis-protein LysW]---L-2-aminoadipate ligase